MQPLQEVHCSNSCEQAAAWSDKPLEMRTRPRTTRTLFWLKHEFITSHCTDVFKARPEKELQCFSSLSSRLLSCHDIPREQKWVMFWPCLHMRCRPPTSSYSCGLIQQLVKRLSQLRTPKWTASERANWEISVKMAVFGLVK